MYPYDNGLDTFLYFDDNSNNSIVTIRSSFLGIRTYISKINQNKSLKTRARIQQWLYLCIDAACWRHFIRFLENGSYSRLACSKQSSTSLEQSRTKISTLLVDDYARIKSSLYSCFGVQSFVVACSKDVNMFINRRTLYIVLLLSKWRKLNIVLWVQCIHIIS